MSQENVDTVRRLYDQWVQGDFSAREPFHDDVDFEMDGSTWPDATRAGGVDGMAQAWRQMLGAWGEFHTGPIDDLIEHGDHIVVVNRIGGIGRHSGAEVDAPRAAVFTFRGEKIAALLLTDRDRALEAVGLSE